MDIIIEECPMNKSISTSYDDLDRTEVLWNNKIELLISHWASDCKEQSILHNKRAVLMRRMYRILGIPSMIIPIVMASFTQLYSDDHYLNPVINSIGYLLTGTLTGINTFMNFASLYEKHFFTEIRFNELYTDIQSILIKHKRDREPADVVLERIKLRYEHINETSPDL